MPVPPVNRPWWKLACSTSDVITCDQNWRHLPSSSAVAKDLSSDTQIRVIGSTEREICTKMLRNLSEKLGFHIISLYYTWLLRAKNFPSRWCFPGNSLIESKPSSRSTTAAKRKSKKKKLKNPSDVGRFLVQKLNMRMPEQKCDKTQC